MLEAESPHSHRLSNSAELELSIPDLSVEEKLEYLRCYSSVVCLIPLETLIILT